MPARQERGVRRFEPFGIPYVGFLFRCASDPIHQHDRVGTGRDGERYLDKVQRHGLGIAEGQDQPRTFAELRADRPEDVDRFCPLILGRRRSRPALGPAARDLVLLADARFILEPYLYGRTAREGGFDLCQLGCEPPFLKASISNSFWA
jgi:hypothetical protein